MRTARFRVQADAAAEEPELLPREVLLARLEAPLELMEEYDDDYGRYGHHGHEGEHEELQARLQVVVVMMMKGVLVVVAGR